MLVLLAASPPPPISSGAMAVPVCVICCREVTMSALREWAATAGGAAHGAVKVNSYGKWKTALQMTSMSLLLFCKDGTGAFAQLFDGASRSAVACSAYITHRITPTQLRLLLTRPCAVLCTVMLLSPTPPSRCHLCRTPHPVLLLLSAKCHKVTHTCGLPSVLTPLWLAVVSLTRAHVTIASWGLLWAAAGLALLSLSIYLSNIWAHFVAPVQAATAPRRQAQRR